jgi:hypothetical protein
MASIARSELLEYERLADLAAVEASSYAEAMPFPHAVIDGFLPGDVLAAVIAEIPSPEETSCWTRWEGNAEDGILAQKGKMHMSVERRLGPTTRQLLRELRSLEFLEVLHVLTGIHPLIPDPYNAGGGLHLSEPGAVLRIHADFERHPLLHLERRLNLLLYLNERWEESYGGHLELWTKDMTACARRIAPLANRCVIFTTGPTSYHGHPDPLRCPRDRTRASIAAYYYTNTAWQEPTLDEFKIRWQNRPGRQG